jgi:hypothetical protein
VYGNGDYLVKHPHHFMELKTPPLVMGSVAVFAVIELDVIHNEIYLCDE